MIAILGWIVCGLFLAMLASTATAQELISVPRADGVQVPLRVFASADEGCAPLALISPGAGGHENTMAYLADALADDGWLAIVIGHKESGPAVLQALIQQSGIRGGLLGLVTDAVAYDHRLMDISAALQWANDQCKAPFTALLGHSMGAATVMIEAGARAKLQVKGTDHFDAYVAISPQGPGSIFPEKAWNGIHKPLLILTGTRDAALEGEWQSRTLPYEDLPPGCKWLGVIDGATHFNFTGIRAATEVEKLTAMITTTFLDGAREGRCNIPVQAAGLILQMK